MRHTIQPDEVESLGGYVKALRIQAGWSQAALAEQTGIDQAVIARIEIGTTERPNPDKLTRLAAALGVASADLFGLAGYATASDLPSLPMYLRTKYGQTISRDERRQLLDWVQQHTANDEQEALKKRMKGGNYEKIINNSPRLRRRRHRSH